MTSRPELQIHRSIAQYLWTAHPKLLWFHVPNGGSRNVVEASILKSMGTLAGVPDIVVVLPGGYVGFMEIKPERAYLSDAQKAFAERASAAGAAWRVVRSIDDVKDTLKVWLHPKLAHSAYAVAGATTEGSV